jgi:hypothetical protein
MARTDSRKANKRRRQIARRKENRLRLRALKAQAA